MTQLEFEFRVYRTPEEGRKRDCIVARNVPHALQVWNESVDSYSRSLELVISGGWLMQMLESADERPSQPQEFDECTRAQVAELCIKGMTASDEAKKQECLEQVLIAIGHDPDLIKSRADKIDK